MVNPEDHGAELLPEEVYDDDIFMSFFDQLWDPDMAGSDWHYLHEALLDYADEHFDIDLDEYIDWEDYGEWYDSTH